MSVLSEATGRGDVLLRRSITNTWGVRWQRSADGREYTGVDLSRWAGVLELRSTLGELWLKKPTVSDLAGLTVATVTPEELSGTAWGARPGGVWLINLIAPSGHIERLADGYFSLEA